MSTEYYLVCPKHKELVHTCSDGLSGPLLQCDRNLAGFVIAHAQCELRVANEHSDLMEKHGAEKWEGEKSDDPHREWSGEDWRTNYGPINEGKP